MAKRQEDLTSKFVILPNKTVFGFISTFIKGKEHNSKNTAKEYERDIRYFFSQMNKGKIENLTINDLYFTNQDIENYKNHLVAQGYAPASIARKISSVKKLYSKLEANDYPVKEAWFNVDKVKGESKSHGSLLWEEVEEMITLAKGEVKGDIKACLIETAVITCFRQNSLLNLKWENIDHIDGVWVLCAEGDAIGKGKKESIKPISDELYEKLIKLKNSYNDEYIFPLQKRTVVTMMQRYREKLGLSDDITFHSLKNCGINEAYELSNGDIMAVAEQGDHKSFGTTMKHYMNKKKKYSDMVGLKIGQQVDLNLFKELTKEELLNLINNASRSLQIELINTLNKK